jgi:hypothetical protein
MIKTRVLLVTLSSLVLAGGLALAQPERDISHHRHPNLAEAQELCRRAWEKVSAAQQANEFDMHGHARKAKELLEQASRELKEAAEQANRR